MSIQVLKKSSEPCLLFLRLVYQKSNSNHCKYCQSLLGSETLLVSYLVDKTNLLSVSIK